MKYYSLKFFQPFKNVKTHLTVHTKICDGPDLVHKLWILTLALKDESVIDTNDYKDIIYK